MREPSRFSFIPSGRRPDCRGFGLIEMLVLIVVVGIMASIAMQSMNSLVKDARHTKTEREMEMLARAIVGDPSIMNGGSRSSFGYVGDVGAFPPNLQALYQNPGGYATWDGPYISPTFAQDLVGFKLDEWGQPYSYSGGTTITSTGSGSTMTRKISDALPDYLLNILRGTITDSAGSPPGSVYADSVGIVITVPNGAGSTTAKTYSPDSTGAFALDSLPVGTHSLRVIYTPNVDTLYRYVTILPRHKSSRSYRFAAGYFSSGAGSLIMAVDSDTLYSSCENLRLWIINNSSNPVDVSSMTLTWSSPTAYYEKTKWDGFQVVDEVPRVGSGEIATFSVPQTINIGDTILLEVETFKDDPTSGNSVDMTGTDFTVLFSDGSTFDFMADYCE